MECLELQSCPELYFQSFKFCSVIFIYKPRDFYLLANQIWKMNHVIMDGFKKIIILKCTSMESQPLNQLMFGNWMNGWVDGYTEEWLNG